MSYMLITRPIFIILFLLHTGSGFFHAGKRDKLDANHINIPSPALPALSHSNERAKSKAATAREFIKRNGYNDKICFLLDMRLPSGRHRFFVYDLKKDSIINAGLVTHGRCSEDWLEGRKYSNTVGSGCTSLGKYRIGYPYQGRFGLAYKLYGLDKTNNKAFTRYVVLHAHDCVPESASQEEICQSDGCPTVSPGFLKYLKSVIDASRQPLLLWIYE